MRFYKNFVLFAGFPPGLTGLLWEGELLWKKLGFCEEMLKFFFLLQSFPGWLFMI